MRPPTPAVARAFGVCLDGLELLPGGQGTTWRAGDVVLKPVSYPPEHAWVCDVYAGWTAHDVVRVPEPVASLDDGCWVVDGWGAHRWVEGRNLVAGREMDLVRQASDAFHDCVAQLPRPSFLDHRSDSWFYGDRVAWSGAQPQGDEPTRQLIAEALAGVQPVRTHSQVVHGDIGGNVLAAEGLPPAVIDWPPYFHPRGFALAVAAADAICWSGSPLKLLDAWNDVPEWNQLLLRAVIYRLATRGRAEALDISPRGETDSARYADQHRPLLLAVLRRP